MRTYCCSMVARSTTAVRAPPQCEQFKSFDVIF
jgi:hypothetical protein